MIQPCFLDIYYSTTMFCLQTFLGNFCFVVPWFLQRYCVFRHITHIMVFWNNHTNTMLYKYGNYSINSVPYKQVPKCSKVPSGIISTKNFPSGTSDFGVFQPQGPGKFWVKMFSSDSPCQIVCVKGKSIKGELQYRHILPCWWHC